MQDHKPYCPCHYAIHKCRSSLSFFAGSVLRTLSGLERGHHILQPFHHTGRADIPIRVFRVTTANHRQLATAHAATRERLVLDCHDWRTRISAITRWGASSIICTISSKVRMLVMISALLKQGESGSQSQTLNPRTWRTRISFTRCIPLWYRNTLPRSTVRTPGNSAAAPRASCAPPHRIRRLGSPDRVVAGAGISYPRPHESRP